MKTKHLFLLFALIAAIALMGCEGEQGPAGPAGADGADGTDGVDGTSVNVCMECHATDPAMLEIALQYSMTVHAAGSTAARGESDPGETSDCARCHCKQGFIQFAVNGTDPSYVADGTATAIDCATCHEVHPDVPSGTIGYRAIGPVTMIWDDTYMLDFGDEANLCANCHQSRRAEPNIDAPADTFNISNTHYGPHHGPQANVLEGVGFAEIAGSTAYPASSLHLNQGATCVTCHMYAYSEDAEGNGMGGHTWHPNLDACNGCHFSPDTDFDHGGVQGDTQDALDELRDLLVAAGVMEYADGEYEVVPGVYPMIQAQAYFNYIGIEEDRSLGVHNPQYVEALLNNTIEAMTPAK